MESPAFQRAFNAKVKWIYEHYGSDLAAFFRDVQSDIEAERRLLDALQGRPLDTPTSEGVKSLL